MSSEFEDKILSLVTNRFKAAVKCAGILKALIAQHAPHVDKLNQYSVSTAVKLLKRNYKRDEWPEVKYMYKAVFVFMVNQHRPDLNLKDINELLVLYPEFVNERPQEQFLLLQFRNMFMAALIVVDPKNKKGELIGLVGRICGAIYVTGGGQTSATDRRVLIFERETGITPVKFSEDRKRKTENTKTLMAEMDKKRVADFERRLLMESGKTESATLKPVPVDEKEVVSVDQSSVPQLTPSVFTSQDTITATDLPVLPPLTPLQQQLAQPAIQPALQLPLQLQPVLHPSPSQPAAVSLEIQVITPLQAPLQVPEAPVQDPLLLQAAQAIQATQGVSETAPVPPAAKKKRATSALRSPDAFWQEFRAEVMREQHGEDLHGDKPYDISGDHYTSPSPPIAESAGVPHLPFNYPHSTSGSVARQETPGQFAPYDLQAHWYGMQPHMGMGMGHMQEYTQSGYPGYPGYGSLHEGGAVPSTERRHKHKVPKRKPSTADGADSGAAVSGEKASSADARRDYEQYAYYPSPHYAPYQYYPPYYPPAHYPVSPAMYAQYMHAQHIQHTLSSAAQYDQIGSSSSAGDGRGDSVGYGGNEYRGSEYMYGYAPPEYVHMPDHSPYSVHDSNRDRSSSGVGGVSSMPVGIAARAVSELDSEGSGVAGVAVPVPESSSGAYVYPPYGFSYGYGYTGQHSVRAPTTSGSSSGGAAVSKGAKSGKGSKRAVSEL